MTIDILARNVVSTPAVGQAELFLDSGNSNALTAKYNDCTFKVLSAEPYQLNESQSLLDAQNDFLDGLKCALKNGELTAAEYTTLMTQFQLYYSSTIDSSGNLNQSISYAAPASVTNDDFGISLFLPANALGSKIALAYTSTVGATTDMSVLIDRLGNAGDVTVAFTSPDPAITLSGYSYVSNSLGGITTSADGVVLEGTASFIGEFTYDATAITPGTYTGVITFSKGSENRFISVEIVIS